MKLVRVFVASSIAASAALALTVVQTRAADLPHPNPVEKREAPCQTAFAFSIHQGPHTGTVLVGTLSFNVDHSGAVTGKLSNGTMPVVIGGTLAVPNNSVKVTGQVTGQAISMVFDLGGGNFAFGSGAAQSNLSDCHGPIQGVLGGPAVGPAEGDMGSWIGDWFCSVPFVSLPYCLYILLHG